jgi:hypothetical protein
MIYKKTIYIQNHLINNVDNDTTLNVIKSSHLHHINIKYIIIFQVRDNYETGINLSSILRNMYIEDLNITVPQFIDQYFTDELYNGYKTNDFPKSYKPLEHFHLLDIPEVKCLAANINTTKYTDNFQNPNYNDIVILKENTNLSKCIGIVDNLIYYPYWYENKLYLQNLKSKFLSTNNFSMLNLQNIPSNVIPINTKNYSNLDYHTISIPDEFIFPKLYYYFLILKGKLFIINTPFIRVLNNKIHLDYINLYSYPYYQNINNIEEILHSSNSYFIFFENKYYIERLYTFHILDTNTIKLISPTQLNPLSIIIQNKYNEILTKTIYKEKYTNHLKQNYYEYIIHTKDILYDPDNYTEIAKRYNVYTNKFRKFLIDSLNLKIYKILFN